MVAVHILESRQKAVEVAGKKKVVPVLHYLVAHTRLSNRVSSWLSYPLIKVKYTQVHG